MELGTDLLVDKAAREALQRLAKGERLDPMLRRLLLDALMDEDPCDRPHEPDALVSDAARSAVQWIAASPEERAEALVDLLLFTDAIGPKPALSLPDKIAAAHESFLKADLSHAFGGAIAVAYYGEPRMTKDIDINVFIPGENWQTISEALEPLGIDIELGDRGLRDQEELRLEWEENSLHFFFSCDPLHEEMERRVRTVPFAEGTLPLVAPEHLVVRKAMLDRTKDWLDIEQILVATDPLDLREIEDWLVRMVSASDSRMKKLDEVKAALSLD
jgi:hypothetical protein